MTTHRFLVLLYSAILSVLFGLIWTAQVLGFVGFYRPISVILLTFVTSVAAFVAYHRLDHHWLQTMHRPPPMQPKSLLFAFLISFLMILSVVFLIRMAMWPYSELATLIPADFIGYHAIKAMDLARTGSAWNLSIPYGQYPFGYESLLAFTLLISGQLQAIGIFHALIFLLALLTIYFLLQQFIDLPALPVLMLALGILFMPSIYPLVLPIGKNDLLLSAAVLVAILHSPVVRKDRRFHPFGLAFATFIAIATKATGLFILVFLWLTVLFFWWQAYRNNKASDYLSPMILILSLVLMFPGGLWVIRNYGVMGQVLSPEIQSFFETSIAANIRNPDFYANSAQVLDLFGRIIITLAIVIAWWIFVKRDVLLFSLVVVIWLTFLYTPLTAFLTPQHVHTAIQWRFVLHGMIFVCILGTVLFAPILLRIYERIRKSNILLLAIIISLAIGTVGLLWGVGIQFPFYYDATLAQKLNEPAGNKTSNAAYADIYEYVQAEIREGVIYAEQAEWYYLAYPNENIRVTNGTLYPLGLPEAASVPPPDYAVFAERFGRTEPQFPNLSETYQWELIYEDTTGQVYKRIP